MDWIRLLIALFGAGLALWGIERTLREPLPWWVYFGAGIMVGTLAVR